MVIFVYRISDGGIPCNTLDTIESIMLTKNVNYLDGVKLDVRKTFDNIYVLSRFNELNKLTYSDKLVNKCSYNYLRKVKFKSHIFKYFIPTLEEILMKYDKKKIIVIELYDSNIEELYYLLKKYDYKYFFISKNIDIINELVKYNFSDIGTIIDYKNVLKKDKNILYIN